jgi:hypothetical protein
MKMLSFLVGKWTGEGRMLRAPGEKVEMLQTENAEYKLDDLLLLIEGIGRNEANGKPELHALGIISYNDEMGTYHMRAFNDGRFLETDMKLNDTAREITWGFALGEIKTRSMLRIDEEGDWTELHEITVGSQAPRKLMEVRVSRRI